MQGVDIQHNESVSDKVFEAAVKSKKFTEWKNSVNSLQTRVTECNVRDVMTFGPTNPGFIVCDVKYIDYLDPNRAVKSAYVGLRGGAVTVLVVINNTWIVGVEQLRIAAGKRIQESVAGMIDESENLAGAAAKELYEEAGIKISEKELVSLGSFYTTAGFFDEKIQAYAAEVTLSEEKLQDIVSKLHGEEGSGETIRLFLLKLDDVDAVYKTQDCKMIFAYEKYLRHKQK